tara:strand:- start:75739 stop:77238 length:1500 start_codon:yes stop_codon:yes gene_type:complete
MADTILDRSAYFSEQYENNSIARDLKKGLKALRGFTTLSTIDSKYQSRYVPQFPEEPQHIYNLRLSRSYLTNYVKRAITSDSGKILANNVRVQSENDDMPEQYESWFDDMDLQGLDIATFANNELQAASWKGMTLAFVDCVKDDEDDSQFRPFVRPIDPDYILDFKANKVTGKLTYIKFATQMEDDSEDATFSSATKDVVFEVFPTEWKAYDKDDVDANEPFSQGEIVRYKDGSKRITNEIPVSILYTNKVGHLLAESPYQTLMELTIEHFQRNSDLNNSMAYALQPILFGQNMPEDFSIKAIASYIAVIMPEQTQPADLKWVQTDSTAITTAQALLKDIESRIATFSIDANSVRPSGNVTATERSIDAAGSNAALRAFASALSNHIERIVKIMASYTLESDLPITVDIKPDFSLTDNNEIIKTLTEMKKEGIISKKAVVDAAIENKTLSKDFDYDEDQEQIKKESAEVGAGGSAVETSEATDYSTTETTVIDQEEASE